MTDKPQTLVWKKTTHYSTDNDNADDRSVNSLAAWKSGKYLIIRQKSETGLFILTTPDGEGQWGLPYLYQAQEAAQCHANGIKYAYSERPALAAATTTPVAVAEQAGDVRQAWRVKPLVWHNYDAWTWWAESTSGTYRVEERNGTWRATLNLPMTEHIIYEYETDGTPNDFEAAHLACESDHAARITAALEPDPTPALGWRAMQTAAAKIADPHGAACNCGACDNGYMIAQAILALPGPTDAQALAEAVKLEAVRELVKAVKRLNDACDAMWNDHKRLEKNSGSFGQPYQIKELHIKAISEAQQALPDALAKIGEAK